MHGLNIAGNGEGATYKLLGDKTELVYTDILGGGSVFHVDTLKLTFSNGGNNLKVGINTPTPTAPLHVGGNVRIQTDSAQAGYVWTAKDIDGNGEWRAVSGGSGITTGQLTDSLNNRALSYKNSENTGSVVNGDNAVFRD